LGVSITRFIEGLVIPVQTDMKPTDAGLPKYLDDRISSCEINLARRADDVL
jgi:hypothetical protein